MREVNVERHLQRECKRLGGVALKLTARGWPDRLVVLPGGRVVFVELKRQDGGKFEPLQNLYLTFLGRIGFDARVIRTRAEVDALLRSETHEA